MLGTKKINGYLHHVQGCNGRNPLELSEPIATWVDQFCLQKSYCDDAHDNDKTKKKPEKIIWRQQKIKRRM